MNLIPPCPTRRSLVLGSAAAAATAFAPTLRAQPAASVTIGYQDMPLPMKLLIESPAFEQAMGGVKVAWRYYDTGAEVATALEKGDIQIGEIGSAPLVAAVTRGVALQAFWIADDIAEAEALVVRNAIGVHSFKELGGRTIAAPALSTSHFQLFAQAAEQRLSPKLNVVAMKPGQIREAWNAGKIDGAFVWNPVLGDLKKDGTVVLTAAQVAARGYQTFDALAGRTEWLKANEPTVAKLLQQLAAANADYLANNGRWSAASPEVQRIARLTKTSPDKILPAMRLYRFPTPKDQLGGAWFGGGVANAMSRTALFQTVMLVNNRQLPDYAVAIDADAMRHAFPG